MLPDLEPMPFEGAYVALFSLHFLIFSRPDIDKGHEHLILSVCACLCIPSTWSLQIEELS